MKKEASILLGVLLLVVGFASVTTTLVLNGTIAFGESDDFEIIFTEAKLDNIRKNSLISEDKKAISFETKELSSLEDKSTLEYTASNTSRNYDANVVVNCHINESDAVNSNPHLDITYEPKSMLIEAGQSKSGSIEIKLVKVLTEAIDVNIKCELVAEAIERDTLGDEYVDPLGKAGTLKAASLENPTDFWEYRANITKIVFENTLSTKETDLSWDVSEVQDGSVMSYLVIEPFSEEERENLLEEFTKAETGMTLEEYKKYCIENEGITEEEFDAMLTELKQEYIPLENHTLYIQSEGLIYANENSSYLFGAFANLFNIEGLEYLDTSKVVNMKGMFYGCQFLFSINMSDFNTGSVMDMSHMFDECLLLRTINVSSFNTSKVTDMSYMFDACINLSEIEGLEYFDTSNVTTMAGMFSGDADSYSKNLISLDLSNFDTSNVTDMNAMFACREGLVNLNISNFDTRNVTNMRYMFSNCESLITLDLRNFDTSKVIDMSRMFGGCDNLTALDLSSFDTSNVTDMNYMFNYCKSLNTLNLSSFNIENVTRASMMFTGMPENAIIKVKDVTTQNFVLSSSNRPSSWSKENVIIK